ncbi:UDP-N-acetylmuramoyl-L-alanine--D-glutamate ligase, partial [Desulfovibrio sp.]|uniref:Mur ligase family protein n=1 Tax=Desulfovibrio sp. TaxID=885 RepID=UPI0030789A65
MAQNEDRGRCIKAGELAVVVGAGRSGKAAARLLLRQGARVRLLESNPQALDEAQAAALRAEGIELVLGEQGPELFAGAKMVVPSPGLPVVRLREMMGPHADAEGTEILAEMELAWRALDGEPVLAVTGTSGKTTTVSLAAAMLREQGLRVFLGGNIGTPLSEYLLSGEKADVLVLETSSFQLQCCSTFHPRVAVVLNISPNHLDYHKDMEEYIEVKFRLFRCQTEEDLAVLEPGLEETAARFGLRARKVWIRPEGRFPDCPLFGQHNQFNAEAAWQACRPFGVTLENAARAVAAFKPLPNRLESVARVHGVLYVNDSKCTTVAALEVALEAMDHPVHLLCGGKFKGGIVVKKGSETIT